MAGRTFYDYCSDCGKQFSARTIIGAQSQAAACEEKHRPVPTRDTAVVMEEIKKQIPDWDGK
jgi:hypothetical protein